MNDNILWMLRDVRVIPASQAPEAQRAALAEFSTHWRRRFGMALPCQFADRWYPLAWPKGEVK